MVQQFLVALREPATAALRQLVCGRRQVVRAVFLRDTPEAPQRPLNPLTQRLERLAVAQRHRLPVRVRQHEVIEQVRKRFAGDRHPQRIHLGEIGLALLPGAVHLREVHLLIRAVQRPPMPKPALQGAQLTRLKLTRVAALQLLEHRLRLKSVVLLEQCLHLRPHRLERIGPGTPPVRRTHLARQLPQSPVLARRALAHPRLHRRRRQRQTLLD